MLLYDITKGVNKETQETHDHIKSDEEKEKGESGEREEIGGDRST